MSEDTKSSSSSGWGGVVIGVFLWLTVGKDMWHSKFRYSIQYGVSYGKITKAKEPRDCDWLSAPLGDKDCHYEVRMSKVLKANDTHGKPIVSYDGGATWIADGESDRPVYPELPGGTTEVVSVFLNWERVEDE